MDPPNHAHSTSRMRWTGLIVVESKPQPGLEDRFDDWACREHIPEMLDAPGIARGWYLIGSNGSRGNEPERLTIYGLTGEDPLDQMETLATRATTRSPEQRAALRELVAAPPNITWLLVEDGGPGNGPRAVGNVRNDTPIHWSGELIDKPLDRGSLGGTQIAAVLGRVAHDRRSQPDDSPAPRYRMLSAVQAASADDPTVGSSSCFVMHQAGGHIETLFSGPVAGAAV